MSDLLLKAYVKGHWRTVNGTALLYVAPAGLAKSFPGHRGRPGKRGGSLPRGSGSSSRSLEKPEVTEFRRKWLKQHTVHAMVGDLAPLSEAGVAHAPEILARAFLKPPRFEPIPIYDSRDIEITMRPKQLDMLWERHETGGTRDLALMRRVRWIAHTLSTATTHYLGTVGGRDGEYYYNVYGVPAPSNEDHPDVEERFVRFEPFEVETYIVPGGRRLINAIAGVSWARMHKKMLEHERRVGRKGMKKALAETRALWWRPPRLSTDRPSSGRSQDGTPGQAVGLCSSQARQASRRGGKSSKSSLPHATRLVKGLDGRRVRLVARQQRRVMEDTRDATG